MTNEAPMPDGGPYWHVGNAWDAEGDEYLIGTALFGLMCGEVKDLVRYLTSSQCKMEAILRTKLVQVLSDDTRNDFQLKFERASHIQRGRLVTKRETAHIRKRNRFIANDLINAGMLERGRQAIAIYIVATQANLTEETIRKIWKTARREAVHSHRMVTWCRENGVDFKGKSSEEIKNIEKSVPKDFKVKTPSFYIEWYMDRQSPDERWRESVFGTSNTF